MIDPEWTKWIHASIASHFKSAMTSAGLIFHLEGEVNRAEVDYQEDWVELRIDGPDYYPAGNNRYRANVEVNVLISTIKGPDKNLYINKINCGKVAEAFTQIVVNDYDASVILACLQPNKDRIETNNFGQVQDRTNLEQATVEGHFDTILVGV
jgi:hypothetical protein